MNPYSFVKMERWLSRSKDGLGYGYTGVTDQGDVYLTFDVRRYGDIYIPVFSHICLIGQRCDSHAYGVYRSLYSTLRGYSIQEVERTSYKILHHDKIYYYEAKVC